MRRKWRSPCLEIGPSFCLPPVESWRGTSPIQAAKSRPDRNAVGSVTVAAIAVAQGPDSCTATKRRARVYGYSIADFHNKICQKETLTGSATLLLNRHWCAKV